MSRGEHGFTSWDTSCLSMGIKCSSALSMPTFLHSTAEAAMPNTSLPPIGPMSLFPMGSTQQAKPRP